jgi:hypothetical protein
MQKFLGHSDTTISFHNAIKVVQTWLHPRGPYSHSEPSRLARVGGVSRDIHVDPIAFTPKLTVRAAMVRGGPRVVKAVQNVPKQGRKTRTVQPFATKSSVGFEGGVGVVIHLSKTRENELTFHPSNRDNKSKLQINHHDKTLTQILIQTYDDLAKLR